MRLPSYSFAQKILQEFIKINCLLKILSRGLKRRIYLLLSKVTILSIQAALRIGMFKSIGLSNTSIKNIKMSNLKLEKMMTDINWECPSNTIFNIWFITRMVVPSTCLKVLSKIINKCFQFLRIIMSLNILKMIYSNTQVKKVGLLIDGFFVIIKVINGSLKIWVNCSYRSP